MSDETYSYPDSYVDELRADNARLRSLLAAREDTLEMRWRDVEALEAENERLLALLKEAKCHVVGERNWDARLIFRIDTALEGKP